MPALIDYTGKRFGRLTVLRRAENGNNNETKWLCRCRCGNTTTIFSQSLRLGLTKSCGCLRKEISTKTHTIHGHTLNHKPSAIYSIWCGMISRCKSSNKRYGGRGIAVCKRWKKFENFYADMGMRPKWASLERKNNDGNYDPRNCKWATTQEQASNRSNTIYLNLSGICLTIPQWAEKLQLNYNLLNSRRHAGKSTKEILRPFTSRLSKS